MVTGTIVCQTCGTTAPRRGTRQFYCEKCSTERDLKRKSLWAERHPARLASPRSRVALLKRRLENGQRLTLQNRSHIATPSDEPNLLWIVRVAVPFSYAASKNAIYRTVRRGFVELGIEARDWKAALIDRVRKCVSAQPIVQNKLWIDIFVEKSDHRGDAVNVIDAVCDALKVATGLDDRWFCIRRVDWSIVKSIPRIIVGFGQDTDAQAQVCCSCGRILPLAAFHSNAFTSRGTARNCKECDHVPPGGKGARANKGKPAEMLA